MNAAVTLLSPLIITEHDPPAQAPLQAVKLAPAAGVAVRVTPVPPTYSAEHVPGQLMPPELLVTVPFPDTDTVNVYSDRNVAAAVFAASIVRAHVVAVPAQAEPQELKPLLPAVSITLVPLLN
jgi:hypothetical protein